jgi:hypothetical protein
MTEPSLPKKSLGLPNANLGLPTSAPQENPETSASEEKPGKKGLGGIRLGGKPKAEKATKEKPVKAAKGKAKKSDAPENPDAFVGEKKSLLKMSPEELKAHFKAKKHGGLEPVIPIEEMVFIPKKPEVNLIPAEVLEGYQASDLKVKFFKIGGAVVFIFLAMFGLSTLSHAMSQGEIKDLEDKAAALNIEIRTLQPYELYKSTIDGKREALAGQVQKNLDVGKILDSVNTISNNAGITFTKVSLDTASTECTTTDPFSTAEPTIGCLGFTAEGNGADSVTKFYAEAGKIKGFTTPYVPGDAAIAKEGKSTLEGTIGVTQEFYATATDKLNVPLETQLQENVANQANNAGTTTEGTTDGK